MFKSNFGSVVKYLALVLELYQDPSKVEKLRDEQRKEMARKRAHSEDQDEGSPVPRKRARNESPISSTSGRERRSTGTPSRRRNRGHYGSPAKRSTYSSSYSRRGSYNSPPPRRGRSRRDELRTGRSRSDSPIPRSESRPRTSRHPKNR